MGQLTRYTEKALKQDFARTYGNMGARHPGGSGRHERDCAYPHLCRG